MAKESDFNTAAIIFTTARPIGLRTHQSDGGQLHWMVDVGRQIGHTKLWRLQATLTPHIAFEFQRKEIKIAFVVSSQNCYVTCHVICQLF